MCETDKCQTAYHILAYLVDNPDAEDTVEGIVEWWLLEQRIKNRTARVKEALAELVSKRLIIERKGQDTRSRYRINRRKSREISAMLKREPGPEN